MLQIFNSYFHKNNHQVIKGLLKFQQTRKILNKFRIILYLLKLYHLIIIINFFA